MKRRIFSISMHEREMERLDAARGCIPRGPFVKEIIRKALHGPLPAPRTRSKNKAAV